MKSNESTLLKPFRSILYSRGAKHIKSEDNLSPGWKTPAKPDLFQEQSTKGKYVIPPALRYGYGIAVCNENQSLNLWNNRWWCPNYWSRASWNTTPAASSFSQRKFQLFSISLTFLLILSANLWLIAYKSCPKISGRPTSSWDISAASLPWTARIIPRNWIIILHYTL